MFTTSAPGQARGADPEPDRDIPFAPASTVRRSARRLSLRAVAAGVLAVAVTGGVAIRGAVPAFASGRTTAITLTAGSWAQFRYSARHLGTNPYETVLSPSDVAGLLERWSFATGNGVLSSPAVANGAVYVGSEDHNVYALNATTGTELWSFPTSSGVYSSPAVANGMVYVGSENGTIYALNATSGAQLWSFATGNVIYSSPAVSNGFVYVGSGDDNVYAFGLIS